MKTNTYQHLENLAAAKGIVCERTGRKIELTTPDGSVTAEDYSVADALDTLRNDSTFSDLPIQIRTVPSAAYTKKQTIITQITQNKTYTAESKLRQQVEADLAKLSLSTLYGLQTILSCAK